MVKAVAVGGVVNTEDVVEGAVIKAVHIEMWFSSTATSGQSGECQMIVEKVPAGQTPATSAQLLNLQAYPNKKNIFFTFQGNIAGLSTGHQPVPVLRNWLLIPKGKQRFGLGDSLVMSMINITQTLVTCGIIIYKEYK